jgi:CheY-like chemotaxis protein
VLVADDEEFCIASMKTILKKSGFDIDNRLDICINGKEMLDLVRNSHSQGITFKLIFSDFSMPGLSGVDAVREIRAFFES